MTDSCECSSIEEIAIINPSNSICRDTHEKLYRSSILVMLERSANVSVSILLVKINVDYVLCFGGIRSHVTAFLYSLQLIFGLYVYKNTEIIMYFI